MHKLEYLRRDVRVGDYNNIVETINKIIDYLNKKVEIEEITINKQVKDFKFFNWETVALPYSATHTLSSAEDASETFKLYSLTYKEMKQVNDAILNWKIVSLKINVEEIITEKEKKQEAVFEMVESEPVKKKRTKWKTKK